MFSVVQVSLSRWNLLPLFGISIHQGTVVGLQEVMTSIYFVWKLKQIFFSNPLDSNPHQQVLLRFSVLSMELLVTRCEQLFDLSVHVSIQLGQKLRSNTLYHNVSYISRQLRFFKKIHSRILIGLPM